VVVSLLVVLLRAAGTDRALRLRCGLATSRIDATNVAAGDADGAAGALQDLAIALRAGRRACPRGLGLHATRGRCVRCEAKPVSASLALHARGAADASGRSQLRRLRIASLHAPRTPRRRQRLRPRCARGLRASDRPEIALSATTRSGGAVRRSARPSRPRNADGVVGSFRAAIRDVVTPERSRKRAIDAQQRSGTINSETSTRRRQCR
jgi:hypothetical protein